MSKTAKTQFPIHPLLQERWSPRAFSEALVEETKLQSLLEAARWAASCFNEQPWNFLIATKRQQAEYDRMLSCLAEANQIWAKQAPVLMLTVAKLRFAHNGKPNPHAYHDIGLAVGNLVVQATALGLAVHQMAGIFPDKARSTYGIPEHYEAVTGVAIGYIGDPHSLPDALRERELAERTRNPVSTFAFQGSWGQSIHWEP
ncbi:MAG: nitroreductase family protein [Nitrospirales bacterium]|nr:nitroreductase family protein [Nitrospira sp.]MDR4501058.1 nitroreductase family protein [Nitrospirales bacterium]